MTPSIRLTLCALAIAVIAACDGNIDPSSVVLNQSTSPLEHAVPDENSGGDEPVDGEEPDPEDGDRGDGKPDGGEQIADNLAASIGLLTSTTSVINAMNWTDAVLADTAMGSTNCPVEGRVERRLSGNDTSLTFRYCVWRDVAGRPLTLQGEVTTNCVDHSGACEYKFEDFKAIRRAHAIIVDGSAQRVDSDEIRAIMGNSIDVFASTDKYNLTQFSITHTSNAIQALETGFKLADKHYDVTASDPLSLPLNGCLSEGNLYLASDHDTLTIAPQSGGNLTVSSAAGTSTLNCSEVKPLPQYKP